MVHSVEQFTEYTLTYPKSWTGKKCYTLLFICIHLHTCVHSIHLVSFVYILSYRHSIIECMVHVCRLRKQYGLAYR